MHRDAPEAEMLANDLSAYADNGCEAKDSVDLFAVPHIDGFEGTAWTPGYNTGQESDATEWASLVRGPSSFGSQHGSKYVYGSAGQRSEEHAVFGRPSSLYKPQVDVEQAQ